jgi:hypothetical protein
MFSSFFNLIGEKINQMQKKLIFSNNHEVYFIHVLQATFLYESFISAFLYLLCDFLFYCDKIIGKNAALYLLMKLTPKKTQKIAFSEIINKNISFSFFAFLDSFAQFVVDLISFYVTNKNTNNTQFRTKLQRKLVFNANNKYNMPTLLLKVLFKCLNRHREF